MKTKIFVTVLFFILSGVNVQAQWKQTNGPSGCDISAFAISGDTVYAGVFGNSDDRGICKSTDNCSSWEKLDMGGLYSTYDVYSLTLFANRIVAGTDGSGIFISKDKGKTWDNFLNGGACAPNITYTALTYSGSNILAGVYNHSGSYCGQSGISLSSDSGATWTPVLSGPGVASFAKSVNKIYAGTTNGIYLSTDNGLQWTAAANIGLQLNRDIRALAVKGDSLFAAVYDYLTGGVYLSTDDGANWIQVNNGLTNLIAESLTISGNKIFVGTQGGGLFAADLNNLVWSPVNTSTGLISKDVGVLATNGNNIYAGTIDGAFLSSDAGTNWALTGVPTLWVQSLGISGNNILAGTYIKGVFYSSNKGANWFRSKGISLPNIYSIVTTSSNAFAGTDSGVYRSDDNGLNWTSKANGMGIDKIVFSFAELNGKIYAGTDKGVYVSTDNGSIWSLLNTGSLDANVRGLGVIGNNIIASGFTSQYNAPISYFSKNNGVNWTQANSSNVILKSFAISGSNMFAATFDNGIWMSSDSGANWSHLPVYAIGYVPAVAAIDNEIFAGTQSGVGMLLSKDNGNNWIEVNSGFSYPSSAIAPSDITSLTISSDYIYAGTYHAGVWKRPLSDFTNITNGINRSFMVNAELSIYPNPAKNNFTVTSNTEMKNARIEIYDVVGEKIYSQLLNSSRQENVICNLNPGIYFVKVKDEQKEFNQKLIIQ